MLTVVVKIIHFLQSPVVFIWTTSFYIGRAIFLLLIKACLVITNIFNVFSIIGEELYTFMGELNISINAVTNYVRNSANSIINYPLEAGGLVLVNIARFFSNTRLHFILLATQICCFIGDILGLIKNALLLIADCAWWLITLLPRWLIYVIIAAGDEIVECLTELRVTVMNIIQALVDDLVRLVTGSLLTFLVWHNRRRLISTNIRWYSKLKRVVRRARVYLTTSVSRCFRRRVERARSPLSRNSITPSSSYKTLDVSQRCVVCRDCQKCVLLLPCKHLCLCDDCADYLFLSSERRNCPLCRTYVQQSMSVYL